MAMKPSIRRIQTKGRNRDETERYAPGLKLLGHVDFPTSEALGPDASEDAIQDLWPAMADLHQAGVSRRRWPEGEGRADRQGDGPQDCAHREGAALLCRVPTGNADAKANCVTYEAGIPAEHEKDSAISDDTRFRAPTMTLTHRGGVDIEESPKSDIATCLSRRSPGSRPSWWPTRSATSERARDHLAAGPAPAETLGTNAPLRHDDAGAQSDPYAAGARRAADPGGLRLQRGFDRDDPASPGSACRISSSRPTFGLRAGGGRAPHPSGRI